MFMKMQMVYSTLISNLDVYEWAWMEQDTRSSNLDSYVLTATGDTES